jgi:histidine triad (HIT) family protein
MSECIFCEILAARAPCHRVYEDDLTLALMDLFPVAPGHTLVIPRRHAENLFEIDADSLAAVSRASRKLARAIRKALNPDGLMVMQLNGVAAGQTVFHYHAHLIPRARGSGLSLQPRVPGRDEELAALADQIRSALD